MNKETITIYYNPRCSKCREVAALVSEHGCNTELIKYLDTPPSKVEIKHPAASSGGLSTLSKLLSFDSLRPKGRGIEPREIKQSAVQARHKTARADTQRRSSIQAAFCWTNAER